MAITRRIITAAGGKQVQANWNESDPNSPAYIQNKPDISGALTRQVVTELPTEDIDPNCIYMIAKSDPETGDYYDEYMYISNEWELIGSTQMTQVQSDWTQSDITAPDYIKYKPPLPQTETINQSATPVLDIEDSVVIRCTTPLTSLTINRVAGGQWESNVYFTTGNAGFTMSVPNTLDGIVGSTVLEPNRDYIVCFKDNRMVISYNGYTGQVSVVNNAPTLAYGQSADIGSVNGTNLSVTMPAAPAVPTVNDATITIQQNGNTVGTFTTNDATDQTINLTGGGSNDWYGTLEEFNQLYQFDENTNYYIEGELARVATSGSYNDLKDQPTYGDIKNTPTIESIAVRGEQITDWYGTKAEFDALEQAGRLEWYKNYYIEGDGAQVNADWNASSGVAEILNKPTDLVRGVNVSGVATALTLRVITQSDYDALVQGGTVDPNTVYMIN